MFSSGHFSENFKPHSTVHFELPGFDYQSGVYYYNVGEGRHRNWEDHKKLGFISAGQGIRWHDAMMGFQKGDAVAAYLKEHGYVVVGVLTDPASPIREVTINGKLLLSYDLVCTRMAENAESDDYCEYVGPVDWVATVGRHSASWKSKASLLQSLMYVHPLMGNLRLSRSFRGSLALMYENLWTTYRMLLDSK